jgi:magnesium-transporting ATPase (P-type)
MFIVFFGSVVLKSSPLNAVQMLWVNLIMDTFGALALATEPPAEDILLRMPYNKNSPIVTEVMQRNVFGHGIYQVICLCVIIFAAPGWLCEDYWNKCVSGSTKDGDCEWNPFYADGPYYLNNEESDPANINWWKKKNLEVNNYNQIQLNKLYC